MEWLNLYGLLFVVLLMIPNIIYGIKCPDGFRNVYHNKLVETLEQIGRFGCMAAMMFRMPVLCFGFWFLVSWCKGCISDPVHFPDGDLLAGVDGLLETKFSNKGSGAVHSAVAAVSSKRHFVGEYLTDCAGLPICFCPYHHQLPQCSVKKRPFGRFFMGLAFSGEICENRARTYIKW